MAFRNPILANESLIRSGIKSENFATGLLGWRVDRDGGAEFNELTARGDIEAEQVKTPSSAAFVPGQASIGIVSTDMPAELLAAGIPNGIVIHSTDWNPAATTRTVKYRFITASPDGIAFGYGVCANPSVSQTAQIFYGINIVHNDATGANLLTFLGQTNNTILEITSQEILGLGYWPLLRFRNPSGAEVASFEILDTFEALNYSSGTGLARIVHYLNENRLHIPEYFVRDLAWQAFSTLNNGWFGAGGVDTPFIRRMPDGTCQWKGFVFKNAAPAGGQLWGTIPAGWRPDHTVDIFCPSNLAAAPGQKVSIQANGNCLIWDFPAGNGRLMLDSVRYPLPEL